MSQFEAEGFCDEKFVLLKEAFEENFQSGLEVGASLAVVENGKPVVDLWGGYTDQDKTNPWSQDTIVLVFSTTKIMTALCALILVDRGELDLDAPVALYWPEFAQAGKQELPVRFVFSHSAGLPGFDENLDFPTALYDWDGIVDKLARQKPWWEPGTESGYHAQTFGFLLGELVRRITSTSIGSFFRSEIAEKINADFYIGLPPEQHHRVAVPMLVVESERQPTPGSVAAKIEASTAFQTDPEILVSNAYRTAEIPAGNGHGNARSVARIASIFSNHGECDGKRFLKTETIDRVLEEQIYVRDHMFGRPVRYGLGMGLSSKEFPLPNPNSLHWGGFGGSFCIMDLDANISVAYAMNRMFVSNGADPRLTNLRKALFTCMPKVTA